MSEPDESPGHRRAGTVRPRGPAHLLRAVAGIDERLLRAVWHERSRHTALGGVVLGTATIAALSMFIAIGLALGVVSGWILVPALIWFLFVLNLDRMLVTSMIGNVRRVGPLLMRIGIAVMFGFIIAEPLVMRIFQTAIEQHIRDERTAALDALRTRLVDCNGESDATSTSPSVTPACAGYVLAFETTPASLRSELAETEKREQALQQVVNTETATLNALRDNATKECGGTPGSGFTGRRGFGPYCDQRIAVAEEYAGSHRIDEKTQQLAALQTRINDLRQRLGGAQAAFERERTDKIEARVAEARSHQGRIGFLERLDALHDLSGESFALLIATWAIRMFFVAIDCLPVIAKFYGGTSGYDELFQVKASSARRLFAENEKTRELELLEGLEERQDRSEQRSSMRRAELHLELQEHKAKMKTRLSDAVSRLATQLHQVPQQRASENGHRPDAPIPTSAGEGRS